MTSSLPPGYDALAPVIATTAVNSCAVCGGQAFISRASGYDYELMTCRNRWHILSCQDCGHAQINPRPADEALPIIYPPHYYSYDMTKHVSSIALKAKAWLDERKFARVFRIMGHKPSTYLDIGCGDLKYLKAMQRHGLESGNIHGVELSDKVVEMGAALGYRVFNEPPEKLSAIAAGSIDLVTLFHVIEHVADPTAVLRRIAELLAPDGYLVLETPNSASLDARLFRESFWGGYHFPRHWHIFHSGSMARLLESCGFTVSHMWYSTGHSFWLYSLHHLLRYNRILPLPLLARFFDPLKNVLTLSLFTLLDVIRARLGSKTSAMVFICRVRTTP